MMVIDDSVINKIVLLTISKTFLAFSNEHLLCVQNNIQ